MPQSSFRSMVLLLSVLLVVIVAADAKSWRNVDEDASHEDPKRADSASALLSRYGRAGNSAVLSRYGKRSSLFAPYPMESSIGELTVSRGGSTSPSQRLQAVGYATASEQLFLCRRAFGDLLRCIPYSSGTII